MSLRVNERTALTASALRCRYQDNMSGWAAAMRDAAIGKCHFTLCDDRMADLVRLQDSGLPTYQYVVMRLDEYLRLPSAVVGLYALYDQHLVCRVIPSNVEGQRLTLIDMPLQQAQETLDMLIDTARQKDYRVVLNEYDPAAYAGIIISTEQQLVIELVPEENLENLAHGRTTPWAATFDSGYGSVRRLRHMGAPPQVVRGLLWTAVKAICRLRDYGIGLPDYVPCPGYFEFVFSRRDLALRFIDYKKVPLFFR